MRLSAQASCGREFRASLLARAARPVAVLRRFAVALLGNAFDRDDLLALLGLEDAHPLGVAAGAAHVVDAAANELTAVRHEHDLVTLLDRKRGDEPPVALVDDHGRYAFAAASG